MKRIVPKIDIYKTGQNIKHIMRMKGMTVKDVQEYLGLAAVQSIYHWFAGRSLPTVDNLYALSELFDVPMDVLVWGNREKEFCFAAILHISVSLCTIRDARNLRRQDDRNTVLYYSFNDKQ